LPASAPRQQKISDVRAGDEQNQTHQSHQHSQGLSEGLAQNRGASRTWLDDQTLPRITAAIRSRQVPYGKLCHAMDHNVDISRRLGECYARLTASHHL
jgi:hypothetical protein